MEIYYYTPVKHYHIIHDSRGHPCYYVKGSLGHRGDTLNLITLQQQTCAVGTQLKSLIQHSSFLLEFTHQQTATLRIEPYPLQQLAWLQHYHWIMSGNFPLGNYRIYHHFKLLARVIPVTAGLKLIYYGEPENRVPLFLILAILDQRQETSSLKFPSSVPIPSL